MFGPKLDTAFVATLYYRDKVKLYTVGINNGIGHWETILTWRRDQP